MFYVHKSSTEQNQMSKFEMATGQYRSMKMAHYTSVFTGNVEYKNTLVFLHNINFSPYSYTIKGLKCLYNYLCTFVHENGKHFVMFSLMSNGQSSDTTSTLLICHRNANTSSNICVSFVSYLNL